MLYQSGDSHSRVLSQSDAILYAIIMRSSIIKTKKSNDRAVLLAYYANAVARSKYDKSQVSTDFFLNLQMLLL